MKEYESPSCTVDLLVLEDSIVVGGSNEKLGVDQVRPFGAPARFGYEEEDYDE